MAGIDYVTGDATRPAGDEPRIIAHVCNDIGGWGAGFVLAVTKRWREPEVAYRRWYDDRDSNDFAPGATQFVEVEPLIERPLTDRGVRTVVYDLG
jgi:hypothetical protein